MTNEKSHDIDICIVGGAGHVGLPLSIVFASKNLRVLIYDTNEAAMDAIRNALMPFLEQGAEPLLRDVLAKGLLAFTDRLYVDQPEYVMLLSWHLADELIPKLREKGYKGKYIVPLPEPRVV